MSDWIQLYLYPKYFLLALNFSCTVQNTTNSRSRVRCFIQKIKLYHLFFWVAFNYLKATEPLRENSLLLTFKSPWVSGAHLINLGKMKGWVDIKSHIVFLTQYPGNLAPWPLGHCSLPKIFFICSRNWQSSICLLAINFPFWRFFFNEEFNPLRVNAPIYLTGFNIGTQWNI